MSFSPDNQLLIRANMHKSSMTPLHPLHLSKKPPTPFHHTPKLLFTLQPLIGLFIDFSVLQEFFGMLPKGTHSHVTSCLENRL